MSINKKRLSNENRKDFRKLKGMRMTSTEISELAKEAIKIHEKEEKKTQKNQKKMFKIVEKKEETSEEGIEKNSETKNEEKIEKIISHSWQKKINQEASIVLTNKKMDSIFKEFLKKDFLFNKKYKKLFKKDQIVLPSSKIKTVEVLFLASGCCQVFLEKDFVQSGDELIETHLEGSFLNVETYVLGKKKIYSLDLFFFIFLFFCTFFFFFELFLKGKSLNHISIRAKEDCVIYFLPGWYLKQNLDQSPFVGSLFYQIVSQKYFQNYLLLKSKILEVFSNRVKKSSRLFQNHQIFSTFREKK